MDGVRKITPVTGFDPRTVQLIVEIPTTLSQVSFTDCARFKNV